MKMGLHIRSTGHRPVYRQIVDQLIAGIERGAFRAGEPLPSSRMLAEQLGVNRATVYRAYEELRALGYIYARPGSYSIVRNRNTIHESIPTIQWKERCSEETEFLYQQYQRRKNETHRKSPVKIVRMTPLQIDPRLYPIREFRRCVSHVLSSSQNEALNYGPEQGFLPLREEIARRMALHGIRTTPDEILITNGAQQAIDLLCRTLVNPQQGIAVEEPTYSGVIPLFRFNGYPLYSVPMLPDGMDLGILERLLKTQRVCFVYTMPNFHNPMGVTTSHAHREHLLRLCARYGVLILEDGFEEEMKYFGRVPLPVKSMDDHQRVVYIGSFSKALFAGLRVGWIIADVPLIQRLTAVKHYTDLSGGHLAQQVLYEFCRKSYYEKHLNRLHRVFRKRMATTIRLMKKHLPSVVRWEKPLGGYTVWIQLPQKVSEDTLWTYTCAEGVEVTHGRHFFTRGHTSKYFRISIASLNEKEIETGIIRLGRALTQMLRRTQ